MDNCQREDAKAVLPSALPEFAEIFSFLNNFGPLLSLPPVSLIDLESFFNGGHNQQQSPVVYCHWSLLTHVTKKDSQTEWQHMAVKFGRKQGLFSEICMYCDLSLEQRMKIFKLVCEGQFDSNVALKEKLANSSSELHMQPIGYDRDGQRHWFFKDFFGDLRLYAEKEYDQFPTEEAVWCLLCRSLEDLAGYTAKLESRALHYDLCSGSPHDLRNKTGPPADGDTGGPSVGRPGDTGGPSVGGPGDTRGPSVGGPGDTGGPSVGGPGDTEGPSVGGPGDTGDPSVGGPGEQEKVQCTANQKRKRRNKMAPARRNKMATARRSPVQELAGPVTNAKSGGCIKCHQDSDYAQLLLCDICNSECHTYCQYPVLWDVPQGTWVCPLCSEQALLGNLKAEYALLVETKVLQEEALEKTKRKAVRLQRSGVLLQNIIDQEEGSSMGRSRRARKVIDYASLNDFYLPPLGPEDYVSVFIDSSGVMGPHSHPMRQSRRLKGNEPDDHSHLPNGLVSSDGQITTESLVTSDGQITSDEHITSGAQATSDEHITSGAQATSDEHITSGAQATSDEHITSGAQATSDEHITSGAQATSDEHITSGAQATSDEHITSGAQATSDEHITSSAQATSDSGAQATSDEHITSGAQATSDEHITCGAQATSDGHSCAVLSVDCSHAQKTSSQLVTSPPYYGVAEQQCSSESAALLLRNPSTHSLCDCYATEIEQASDIQQKTVKVVCLPGRVALPVCSTCSK